MDSTWKQMERNISKEGFREGVGEGRDASFQTGFDDGYAEGQRIGRILGKTMGIQKYLETTGKSQAAPVADSSLKFPRLGACLICSKSQTGKTKEALPENVYETRYEDIILAQKAHNDSIAVKLKP